jgi:8-oxo-dGTP diphosphatase
MTNAPPPHDARESCVGGPASPVRHPLTHRVAVGAYIFSQGRMLLLKRANWPIAYAPPGGHLDIHEDPEAGVRREVREETGLEIRILSVAGVWFGTIRSGDTPMLGIDYLAECDSEHVTLSVEHVHFMWVTPEDIRAGRVETLDQWEYGYKPEALLMAFELYKRLHP